MIGWKLTRNKSANAADDATNSHSNFFKTTNSLLSSSSSSFDSTTLLGSGSSHSQRSNNNNDKKRSSSLKFYFDHETQDRLTALHCLCKTTAHLEDTRCMIQTNHPDLIACKTIIGGDTPLHFAVAAHDIDKVRLLLQRNPKVVSVRSNSRGCFGDRVTPIQVAMQTGAPSDIIDALVRPTEQQQQPSKSMTTTAKGTGSKATTLLLTSGSGHHRGGMRKISKRYNHGTSSITTERERSLSMTK